MDSELQIGLVALGVAAVVGIVAYNKWQERKHRQHAEKAFKSEHRDVLLEKPEKSERPGKNQASRVEPRLGADEPEDDFVISEPRVVSSSTTSGAASVALQSAERDGMERGGGDTGGRNSSGRYTRPARPEAIDPRIDCMILVESIRPLEGSSLWAAQHEQLQVLNKPVRWFGFDDRENLWRVLTPHTAGEFHWFCVAMQMVDRRGAISDDEFDLFVSGVHHVADQFMAVPAEVPPRATALASATAIDGLCAAVDIQVGINIIGSGETFAGTKIRALAEAGGMTLGDDGAFHALDEEGRTLFTLGNMEAQLFSAGEMRNLRTSGVTLLIDVPLVIDGAHVFDRMMRQATKMAETLHGVIVDDNRNPIGPDAAKVIRSQIQQYQARMAQEDIPAGGPVASRLFSA